MTKLGKIECHSLYRATGSLYNLSKVCCVAESGKKPRIVCPETFKTAVLDRAHRTFGHLGENATLTLVREGFFWVNLLSEVGKCCQNCQTCCATRPRFQKTESGNLISCARHMQQISIGPKVTISSKKKWIYTVIDEYTRFLEAFFTK